MTEDILAEGVWCNDCEFFEEPDFAGDMCMACACLRDRHDVVRVVTFHD